MHEAGLRQVVYALSDALDLVGVEDVGHGKRVGIMASECARVLGLSPQERSFLFDLGLLHDIGVSSTYVHGRLVGEFDWSGSQSHAETGYLLLRDFQPLAAMALPILYHHRRWKDLEPLGLPPSVAFQANLTYLVDRADALAAPFHADGTILMRRQEVADQIARQAGTYFPRDLVEAFREASRSEAFGLLQEPQSIQICLRDELATGENSRASVQELKALARIFSRIVDAKSRFTAVHSLGVARLSRFLGPRVGLAEELLDRLEIAGLLHDLGKLRVPDEVLDKPGRLDDRERAIIQTHSFGTYQILHQIPGFEDITTWAAWHHEEPGGGGYPFHLKGEGLPLPARILRVADIFQAMVQDRPYRAGLSAEEVKAFMLGLASEGRVDGDLVSALLENMEEALAAARPSAGELS